MKNPSSKQPFIYLPAKHLGWITLIVCTFLLISSVAYALSPTLQRLYFLTYSIQIGYDADIMQMNMCFYDSSKFDTDCPQTWRLCRQFFRI